MEGEPERTRVTSLSPDPCEEKKCHLQNSKLQIMWKLEPCLVSDGIGQKWAEGRRLGSA